METNKCERCRYSNHSTRKCTAQNSENYQLNIDDIGELEDNNGCKVFYSEIESENMSAAELDPDTPHL